jgi:LPLT family lysophospholipid transporter-like MFS transporter
VLGAIIGGIFISPTIAEPMLKWWDVPFFDTGIDTPPELAITIIVVIYIIAAWFNLYIPRVAIDHKPLSRNPVSLSQDFWHSFKLLWRDPLGQVSLAVTTLFWGIGATLRLLVLSWAGLALHYDMARAAALTAWVAVGIAIGAMLAAKFVKLQHSVRVLPVGIAMGLMVLVMIPITNSLLATLLLIVIGAMGGYFVVPMNALLQHRGHLLMGAGSSIAVQNFNENLSIFVMLGLYAAMEKLSFSIYFIILVFGLLLAGIMTELYRRHRHDQDSGQM